jgi:hypothetical protein
MVWKNDTHIRPPIPFPSKINVDLAVNIETSVGLGVHSKRRRSNKSNGIEYGKF